MENRLRRIDAPAHVGSAGLRAVGGPPDELAQQALAARGFDRYRHEPNGVTPELIADATVILAMERAHVAEIAMTMPNAFAKTFGLTEIVALGAIHGPRRDEETVSAWLARLQAGRRPVDVLQADATYDIADPHGGSTAGYERCANELTRLIDALIVLLN